MDVSCGGLREGTHELEDERWDMGSGEGPWKGRNTSICVSCPRCRAPGSGRGGGGKAKAKKKKKKESQEILPYSFYC